jgi:ferritin-like metal-binding protein YciE
MPALLSLHDLLVDEIRDLFHAENALVKAIPKLAKAATNVQLRQGLLAHLKQTKIHVLRLKRIAKLLGTRPTGKTCHAMAGLIREAEDAIGATGPDEVRDANIIGAAQRIEHYEVSAYGTARTFAQKLGEIEAAALLQETLDEERETDRQLTAIARQVNDEAANADSETGG